VLCQAVTPAELVSRATWTQPKLEVSRIPHVVPEAHQHSWDEGFSRAGCLQNSLTWVFSLPREPGTSVGKKYDGECKKETATVSELRDGGQGFSPADTSGNTASVSSSSQSSSMPWECNCCCASTQGRFCFLHT